MVSFLEQYYISQEYPAAPAEVIQNIDSYLKLETLTDNTESTELLSDLDVSATEIDVSYNFKEGILGTYNFPERYGLIQIDDEIIMYESKTANKFKNCKRGFSGVTSFEKLDSVDELVFETSETAIHYAGAKIKNLSALLFTEFLTKYKTQFAPGFESRQLDSNLDERKFLGRVKDFYSAKGTDKSFSILFGALYGEDVEVIKPKDVLFRPSDAQYRVTKDIVVEAISGDPLKLRNQTLFQDAYPDYGIEAAYASISGVEKLYRNGTDYYKLSVDFDYSKDITFDGSVFGSFSVHPLTKAINAVGTGKSIINVDSTIGFPDSGELFVQYDANNSGIVTYTSKTVTQFLSCDGVTQTIDSKKDLRLNVNAYSYIGSGTDNKVDMRIGSVLSDFNIDTDTYYYSKDDTAKIKTLGLGAKTTLPNSWIVNASPRYQVRSSSLIDLANFSYRLETYASGLFAVGDTFSVTTSTGDAADGTIVSILNDKSFTIGATGALDGNITSITKKILKPKLSSGLSKYNYLEDVGANVQNVYVNGDETVVAAPSLPFYEEQSLNFYDRVITLNGSYSGDTFDVGVNHGYQTGDAIYYNTFTSISSVSGQFVTTVSRFSNINDGVYFVKKVDDTNLKIATSKSNLNDEIFVSVSGIVTSNTIVPADFQNKIVDQQKLVRQFKTPDNTAGVYPTAPDQTVGMLINGVEIANYKSGDVVYHGAVNSIDVVNGGSNYDVINPPILSISDSVGTGATGHVSVKGSLKEIQILDPGFDYVTEPVVTITGGNGYGAVASVNLQPVDHSVSFNAIFEADQVDLSNNRIGFSTFHKFRNAEKVFYKTDGQDHVVGLSTDAEYFVRTVDSTTISLHTSHTDAVSGSNAVSLTGYGVGIHRVESAIQKNIISNITVSEEGSGYENKIRKTTNVGILTASNEIKIANHGFNSGEFVRYSFDTSAISGLSSETNYYVTRISDDKFKLSSVGVGTTAKDTFYKNRQYVDFASAPAGNHTFNYEPISVTVSGQIGVTTFTGQNFQAEIRPLFRGSLNDIFLVEGGSDYGSDDIINYNRKPTIRVISGEDAECLPIIHNGRIQQVLVTKKGSNYNTAPELLISGSGSYGKLTPIIENGELTSVIVASGGIDYGDDTRIIVVAAGSDATFEPLIEKWTVNSVEKYREIISNDDGILIPSLNEDNGIQYAHLYAPRQLRKSLFGKTQENSIKYGVSDLQIVNSEEVVSSYHSPIIGWAYDGNPIYGPYGFANPEGGLIKGMVSGYTLKSSASRPSGFALGFFVEDYEWTNAGDLDEHNGRFCITPDYPNGTYAYFATINPNGVDVAQPFRGFKAPQFPYLVGNSFKSVPNTFNNKFDSTQDNFDFSSYFRNVTPLGMDKKFVDYDYVLQPNKVKDQTIDVKGVSTGHIEEIGIVTGGRNYRVNDPIVFTASDAFNPASARVSKVGGKVVKYVSVASSTVSGIEVIPGDQTGTYVAIAATPHNFTNNNLVNISGVTTSVRFLGNTYNIGVNTNKYSLDVGVGTAGATGVVTFFAVNGLNESVREDDIYQVGSEQVRILSVDRSNFRLRVLREATGAAHTATSTLAELPRQFTFKSSVEEDTKFNANRSIYFNPVEALGLGVAAGVGIGTTISFSNPGAGKSEIFVPQRSIFLPQHGLKTGDLLKYEHNGDSIGVSTNGSTIFYLPNNQTVFVARLSPDLIGISTVKLGIGATGTFVGAAATTASHGQLYFTGIGTGVYHKFTTVRDNVVKVEASKNIVTVAAASTHGLDTGDKVDINVISGITTSIEVQYNEYNRRIVFNPITFVAANVDTNENTIELPNHGLKTGDKVIHTSSSVSGGLVDQKIYYIYRYTNNLVKLTESRYQTTLPNPTFVNITSAGTGTIAPVNPNALLYRDSTVEFDLSHSSLSFTNNSTQYSAFDMNLYLDSTFLNEFESTLTSDSFEVSRRGKMGIDSNAALILRTNSKLPYELYYKFTPINTSISPVSYTGIYIDDEVAAANSLCIKDSVYNGEQTITGIGTTSFTFDLADYPEADYTESNGNLTYTTGSTAAYGPIVETDITFKGNGYSRILGVSTVTSSLGENALLTVSSKSIGKIISTEIMDIGFDYPTDPTLKPTSNLPEVLELDPLASFARIGISSAGQGYSIAPKLVVLDGTTGDEVTDLDITYELGDTEVTIIQNTQSISNEKPTIIPTSNSNGVGVNTFTYNPTTNKVSAGLNTNFSDSAPFAVGDKVLIEGVSVGVGSTGLGYNSADYGFRLFTLESVHIPLGGAIGIVTYSMDGFVANGKTPGNVDYINSAARMIAEKDFPQFDVSLTKNKFIGGETVDIGQSTGIVESFNVDAEIIKISTSDDLAIGDIIEGRTSRTKGRIQKKYEFGSFLNLGPSSIVKKGFSRQSGFLNLNTERIQDNDYYQNFSYSIKSRVALQDWDDAVSSMNHTGGFLKFSDLMIESQPEKSAKAYTNYSGSTVDVIADLGAAIDLNCVSNFDLGTENELTISTGTISDEIYFSSKVLTDYFESVGNRVLMIDDISPEFNSDPRATRFSIVDQFDVNQRTKKYAAFVRDQFYTGERQVSLVTVLHDTRQGVINQFGRVDTGIDLGSYDFNIAGSEGQLLFYPTKYAVNNYNVSFASFDLDSSVSGIGSTNFGVVDIATEQKTAAAGSRTPIVSIANTYRSSKLLVEIDADNGKLEYNELSYVHDGTHVEILEYGQMTTQSLEPEGSGVGLGTYGAELSGGNVVVYFTPISGIACTANTMRVAMTTDGGATGVSSHILGGVSENIALVSSFYTSISASGSPGIHTVAQYTCGGPDDYQAAMYIVSIENTTDSDYFFTELVGLNDNSQSYLTQYGDLVTNEDDLGVGIGTIGLLMDPTITSLQYTPPANKDVQVRVFQMAVQLVDVDGNEDTELDFNNGSISAGYGYYTGTDTDIKRAFNITHDGRDVFERLLDLSSTDVVDVTNNTITVPEHFFVSGEKVTYNAPPAGSAVGIGTTTFAGVGSTDLLPSEFFVIKVDEMKIKVARTAEEALASEPIAVDLTGVGVGTAHTLTAQNQNTKCLITLDNYVQSPIVSTAVTTGITTQITLVENTVTFQGITSFFGGDMIKVDNEIMKIRGVGIGSTNSIQVDRGWMGTDVETHDEYAIVRKVEGSYNIVGNTLNFYTAPQGLTPIGSTTNPPDERDWTGISTSSTFQGRAFLRGGIEGSSDATYETNYIFDDISGGFNGVTKDFTLQSERSNISGFADNNAVITINGVFQGPTGQLTANQDYTLTGGSGITTISFTGTATSVAYDANNASIPVGGVIVSVGSTGGLGYQPLVAAGGTAIVSTGGTITSVSIGNSGSGYRPGAQQIVKVGVRTDSTNVNSFVSIGTAAISGGHIVSVAVTNPATGYVQGSEPTVVIDAPLSYSNIPLIYSSDSSAGVGTQATIDIVVGQGSSVIDFELRNLGYNYDPDQILTVAIGGTTGIPTSFDYTFDEFQLTVKDTDGDKFSGWHFGELEVLDKIEEQFDGEKRAFTLTLNGNPVTIRAAVGSNIDVQASLLVFINDILQVPGESYTFEGGSVLNFQEPPKGASDDGVTGGDTCKVLFYKGSGSTDVVFRDILETVKPGDKLKIDGEEFRLSNEIVSTNQVRTNPYQGVGIDGNPDNERVITWCKQTSDVIIDGKTVSKARQVNEARINPTTVVIQPVSTGSSIIHVESVRTFFDPDNENQTSANTQKIFLTSQDTIAGASATAVVSAGGTISSIVISDGGRGYTSAPTVSIGVIGTATTATAGATITGDVVTGIAITNGGTGFASTNPPQVLVEVPSLIRETNDSTTYYGDFGHIVGVNTTSVGAATTGYVFDFFIPEDSYLRDSTVVGTAVTLSGISTNYYFVVNNSNVGSGVTSLYQDNSVLGVGTNFLDGVYQVAAVSIATTAVAGVGITYVARVTTSVSHHGTKTGIGLTEFYGEYSWGRIQLGTRVNAVALNSYTLNGYTGIATGGTVTRVVPLKNRNYT